MQLNGKKAIITGAASGIGQVTAKRFTEEGSAVACIDIDATQLEDTVDKLLRKKVNVIGFVGDVSDPNAVNELVEKSVEKLGGVDILINNAGISYPGTIEDISYQDWNRNIAVNLSSFFLMSKAVWPRYVEQNSGSIINMSSIMGLTGLRNSFAYCSCKAGIIAFTKSLAADGAPLGIRVNCICPGYVDTPLMNIALREVKGLGQAIIKQVPAQRMATAAEIANGFVFLASDQASYVNGANLVIDGAATVGFGGSYID